MQAVRDCYVHCNPITRFDAWGLGDITIHVGKNATKADAERASSIIADALKETNSDGSKPVYVQRLEYILSSENEHDVDVVVGEYYVSMAPANNPVNAENGKGTGTTVYYNPNSNLEFSDGVKEDPASTLIHETAGHAHNNAQGTATTSSDRKKEEQDATYVENTYRANHGLEQRKKFGEWDVETVPEQSESPSSSASEVVESNESAPNTE